MKNRVLLLCLLAAIVGFLPFLSYAGSSNSNVGGDSISMASMIGDRKGFVYSITTPKYGDPSSPVVVTELASILNNIVKFKPRVFGHILHIDSYELRCLQEIEIRGGCLMRTSFSNFKENVNAESQEGQLIHIIAEKELIIIPEQGSIIGAVCNDIIYRVENITELKDSDQFVVFTLLIV